MAGAALGPPGALAAGSGPGALATGGAAIAVAVGAAAAAACCPGVTAAMVGSGAATAVTADSVTGAVAAVAVAVDVAAVALPPPRIAANAAAAIATAATAPTMITRPIALGELLRKSGQAFADAPVSGGVIGAREGTLAIMVGSSAVDYARAEPLLKVLGRPTRVGPVGCGQLSKLCNQLIVGATIGIVAEALLLAQAGGADPAAMRAAIRGGFAESRILDVHGQRMLERNFCPGGQVKSQAKDMNNILRAAADSGLHLPIAELVSAMYLDLTKTLPNADHAAALLALERLNPGKRVGDAPDRMPSI